jgi:hypothetical protein
VHVYVPLYVCSYMRDKHNMAPLLVCNLMLSNVRDAPAGYARNAFEVGYGVVLSLV